MRCPAPAFRLLAHPVLALNHKWLIWCELQMKPEVFRDGVERLILTVPLRLTSCRSILAAGRNSPPPHRVQRDSSVRQTRNACPSRRSKRHGPDTDPRTAQADLSLDSCRVPPFTKEHQLEAEPFTLRLRHITRVIPPFRAKIFVFEMIPGKLVRIAGKSFAILEAAPRTTGEYTAKAEPAATATCLRVILIP